MNDSSYPILNHSSSTTIEIPNFDDEPEIDDVFSERLRMIEREANGLLEKLTLEFESIKSRINERATDELTRVTSIVERNRTYALEALMKEFSQKRDSINLAAQQQIQCTYKMASDDRIRRSMSTENLWGSPNTPKRTRPSLPFREKCPSPQVYVPSIHAVIEFPRIYMKPYDTPSVTPVAVAAFPDRMLQPSI
jgi:hypothetical protein